jgi:hypothetical protein
MGNIIVRPPLRHDLNQPASARPGAVHGSTSKNSTFCMNTRRTGYGMQWIWVFIRFNVLAMSCNSVGRI